MKFHEHLFAACGLVDRPTDVAKLLDPFLLLFVANAPKVMSVTGCRDSGHSVSSHLLPACKRPKRCRPKYTRDMHFIPQGLLLDAKQNWLHCGISPTFPYTKFGKKLLLVGEKWREDGVALGQMPL